ncbi:MAG: cytochrome c3 family protein [Planctomycetota bacterium]
MKRLLFFAAVLFIAAGAATAVFALRRSPPAIVQPIAFDHARHVQEELGCLDCHKTAETSPHASAPLIATCMLCHNEAKGEHPDEPKIRGFAERGEQIPWVQVNRLAGHVYFSHAMHVKLGKMECSECHGDMAAATLPVTRSQVDHLTMSQCMDCHREREASNDCLTCHK